MGYSSLLLALTGASFAAAQGFSSECSDLSLNGVWLIGTCPTGSGSDITSSVYLGGKIGNNNGQLEWGSSGYSGSCENCSLNGGALECTCFPGRRDASLNLEEHIANYEGHLLSNLTGPVTTIPEDSPVPVPSDLTATLQLATSAGCSRFLYGIGAQANDCYWLTIPAPGGDEVTFLSGSTETNAGWEITAYSERDCANAVVTINPETHPDGECVDFEGGVRAFSARPLWNADI
ncbi:Cyanovirin-N [Aspergillus karnatakaensis]|uniref:CVNH domain-containing protein n=1 Tax=Aspergillus karnatakaensis TaxID=1810916 RepID=UPI003CCE0BF6